MRYRIGLIQRVHESTTVEVEAVDEIDAQAKAIKLAENGLDWDFDSAVEDSIEVVSVDEVVDAPS